MIATNQEQHSRPSTYTNGQPYKPARGRFTPRQQVEDHWASTHSIVSGRPSAEEFLRLVIREMKIRGYRGQSFGCSAGQTECRESIKCRGHNATAKTPGWPLAI